MNDIKTNEVYDNLVDNYLMHFGVPGQKKGQYDPNRRWQSHAVYAQGKPNPDAKVRGEKDGKKSSGSKSWLEKRKDVHGEWKKQELAKRTKATKEKINKLNEKI